MQNLPRNQKNNGAIWWFVALALIIAQVFLSNVNDYLEAKIATEAQKKLFIQKQIDLMQQQIDGYNIDIQFEMPQNEPQEQTTLLEGPVSYYSDEGCLKCREDRIMANGQVFDENAMTLAVGVNWVEVADGEYIAVPEIPLNTEVLVINTTNGKSVRAIVTDTGGFNVPEYGNRIADLSSALASTIGVRTDKDLVKIVEVQ